MDLKNFIKDIRIEWHAVTWYSKLATLIVVLATYVFAFMLGVAYEKVHIETLLQMAPYIIQ